MLSFLIYPFKECHLLAKTHYVLNRYVLSNNLKNVGGLLSEIHLIDFYSTSRAIKKIV